MLEDIEYVEDIESASKEIGEYIVLTDIPPSIYPFARVEVEIEDRPSPAHSSSNYMVPYERLSL